MHSRYYILLLTLFLFASTLSAYPTSHDGTLHLMRRDGEIGGAEKPSWGARAKTLLATCKVKLQHGWARFVGFFKKDKSKDTPLTRRSVRADEDAAPKPRTLKDNIVEKAHELEDGAHQAGHWVKETSVAVSKKTKEIALTGAEKLKQGWDVTVCKVSGHSCDKVVKAQGAEKDE